MVGSARLDGPCSAAAYLLPPTIAPFLGIIAQIGVVLFMFLIGLQLDTDLVVVFLLPAFFAFTGMRTRIGLVSGVDSWVVCAVIVAVACLGKFGGSAAAARLSGLNWRTQRALACS